MMSEYCNNCYDLQAQVAALEAENKQLRRLSETVRVVQEEKT